MKMLDIDYELIYSIFTEILINIACIYDLYINKNKIGIIMLSITFFIPFPWILLHFLNIIMKGSMDNIMNKMVRIFNYGGRIVIVGICFFTLVLTSKSPFDIRFYTGLIISFGHSISEIIYWTYQ